ncbi:hypothetical protein LWI29_009875 [Acer saccharum]|uniref:Calcineurin-like phosphoesterase domain-containing protein n=1 Tax=Acer saccharum TaxID=4024 RepID=A0AA39S372_ACESA|nr:hypothetical protein LWI29_009875 [Acer saccharum]KAK1563128.1 hypothetical protein Q3G72_022759 [Acer saccharum]
MRQVIDFLISLPKKHPEQKHVYLSGNHDLAFSAFVGVLPKPSDDSEFKKGWKKYEHNEEREGWFNGDGYESMHLQRRRWAGDIKDRFNFAKVLVKAVPDDHKKFLADMVWIHEADDVAIETKDGIKHCKLIAVHAGLEKGKNVEEQLKRLKAKDTGVSKVEALSGRKNVWDIPQELIEKPTIIVSGHHGKLQIDGLRLIIDEGGGLPNNPVAAVVLPSKKIVSDTDNVVKEL